MLRDYAVSMMLVLFVLLGYTALLFWKKTESPTVPTQAEASSVINGLNNGSASTADSAGEAIEH